MEGHWPLEKQMRPAKVPLEFRPMSLLVGVGAAMVALHLILTVDLTTALEMESSDEWHGGGKEEVENDESSAT
ncbi:hypothetical protein BHE74_00032511 [Ensete ventricosum]|nr:hypothetical protein BHE74_00032511 [Ensete ventricosum]